MVGIELLVIFITAQAVFYVLYQLVNHSISRSRWLELKNTQFKKLQPLECPGLDIGEVISCVAEAAKRKGEFVDYGRLLRWSILLDRIEEAAPPHNMRFIELTVRIESQSLDKPYNSWGIVESLKSCVWIRLLMDETQKGVQLCPEWTMERSWNAYPAMPSTAFEEEVLRRVIAAIEDELRGQTQIGQTFGGQTAPGPASAATALSSPSKFVTASAKHFGSVKVPARIYNFVSASLAIPVLEQLVNKGGMLKEPISGALSLRWEGSFHPDPNKKGLLETAIRFSDYGEDLLELSNEIVISWQLSDVPGANAIRVSCQWSGEFKQSSGDMIRFLVESLERELIAVGAQQVLRPGMQAAAQGVSRARQQASFEWFKDSSVHTAARPFWPSLQDYNEAIQNPQTCFGDDELKHGQAQLTSLGLPRVATGAFASVYKISCNGRDYAVRCFNTPIRDQEERYRRTSRFICADDLIYTVNLFFLEKGICVRGQWYPILKMEWVEGPSVYEYIEKHLFDRQALQELRQRFFTMMHRLQEAGIAHSDLQHGNIIIRDDDFVLVDYDGMFVPELSGFLSNERGHPNYQHPGRDSRHFGPYLDNFSAWIIDTALLCLIKEPELWARFASDGESLMFKRKDFEEPCESELLSLLAEHADPELRERAELIRSFLLSSPEKIPFLSGHLPEQSAFEARVTQVSEKETAGGLPDWMQ